MANVSIEALEGRLMAQRRVLGLIVAGLGGSDLLDELGRLGQYEDAGEDPGAVPSPAFAIEAARADEFRLILEEARRRMAR